MEKHQSILDATTSREQFDIADQQQSYDVAIIGGGITGVMTAYALTQHGISVALFEAERIGSGTTGNTTAKVTSMHDLKYAFLSGKAGEDVARKYAQSHEWAIGELQQIIEKEKIQCDFSIASQCAYALTDEGFQNIQKECEAARKAGINATLVEQISELPIPIKGALKFEHQAYFHPTKFLFSIAQIVKAKGVSIFEHARVTKIENAAVYVGEKVIGAKNIVIATNYPIYDKALFFLRMNQMRSYAAAAQIDGNVPKEMYVGVDGDRITFRPYSEGGKSWLIVGGEDHVTGDTSGGNHFEKLENNVRKYFSVQSVDHKWAAQDSMPIDRMPIIGKMPMAEHMFVATGFGEWGMTTGIVASKIIADLITGTSNEWVDIYTPSRFKPRAAAEGISSQISQVTKGFGAYLTETQQWNPERLGIGEGKIFDRKGEKIAAYKDDDGSIHTCSAKCTHMKCIVNWNKQEKSWDCPCHGSRFNTDGEVLNSPAVEPLEKIELDEK